MPTHMQFLIDQIRTIKTLLVQFQVSETTVAQFDAIGAAFQGYSTWTLEQFIRFLAAAEQFQKEGRIAGPPPPPFDATALQESLRTLANRIQAGEPEDSIALQKPLAEELNRLAVAAGLSGKLKADARGAGALRERIRVQHAAAEFRAVAQTLKSPEDYADPTIALAIEELSRKFSPKDMKRIAQELGLKLSGADRKKQTLAMLIHASGTKPAPAPATKKAKPAVDAAVVVSMANDLHVLMEKSINPDALTGEEIEAQLSRLQKLDLPTLKEVVQAASVDLAGKTKTELLNKIRGRLTASKRARAETSAG